MGSLFGLGVEEWVLMGLVVKDIAKVCAQLLLEGFKLLLVDDLHKVLIIKIIDEIEVLELDDHGTTLVDKIFIVVVVTFDVFTLEVSVVVQVILVMLILFDVEVFFVVGDLFGVHGFDLVRGLNLGSHLNVKLKIKNLL